ncbi:MAG: hypothetical protein LBT86_05925 [Deltaproteobacteria bacterium]|nr:hypothetical protein [Deltaproteobacteria bacterium]
MPLGDNDIAIYVLFHDLSVDKLIASWNDPLRDPTADEQQTFDYLYKTFNVPPIRVKYALEKINAVMLAIKSRRSIIVKKGSEWMIASDDELSLIEKNLEKLDKSFSRFLEYGVKWITRPKAPKSSPPNKIPKNGIL